MKTILFSLLLLASLTLSKAQTTNCNVIVWNPPPTNAVDATSIYKLYHSTNSATPLTNWVVVAEAPAAGVTNIQIAVLPGVHFFYLTFSNFWGESPPSNVVSTPAAPYSPIITIERVGP